MTDSFPTGEPRHRPTTFRTRLHIHRRSFHARSGPDQDHSPAAAWRPVPARPPSPRAALRLHGGTTIAPAPEMAPSPANHSIAPSPATASDRSRGWEQPVRSADGAVARRAYGPDGPGDAPWYERSADADPEGTGDLASLVARRPAGDPTAGGTPARLRDRLPRGRQLGRVGVGVAALLVLGAVTSSGALYASADLAATNPDFTSNNTAIYYNNGQTELATLSVQNRTTIGYQEIPQSTKDAVIAAENRTFWEDPGISVPGMARAMAATATGDQVQGGSTITQQYVKLVYLSPDRTLGRKVREIVYAIKLTNDQSKEQILGEYLNTVFFGRDAYGVQAAAHAWFDKEAVDLTLGESAVLAAVIQNPSILDPANDPDNLARLEGRYEYVLSGMLEMGTISRAEYDEYSGHLPSMPGATTEQRYRGPQGFLVNMVEQELQAIGFEDEQINGGGLRITTTFDPAAQRAAEEAALEHQDRAAAASAQDAPRDELHAAIASVNSNTGAVLALHGGDDFVQNSRNWATTPRMTGSTFKAFGVVAGLRDGFSLRSTFTGNTFQLERQPMPVRNEFERNYGPRVTLLRGTQDSVNTVFVDMVHQMQGGPRKVMKAANDAGAPSGMGWGDYDRMVLGEPEVSPLHMAAAYATITNGGIRHDPHVVTEVRDMHGNVLYTADTRGEQTIETDVARDTTYALQQVTEAGTGTRAAELGRPVASKTGTAGAEDAIYASWFIGATTEVSTAVMYVAGDDGQSDLDPYAAPGQGTFFGSGYPATTWLDYMEVATKDDPWEDFPPPAGTNRPRLRG